MASTAPHLTAEAPASPASPRDLDLKSLSDPEDIDTPSAPPIQSAFVNLTRGQAVRTFWYATMCCFFAGVCVLMEGYQSSTAGSIVSNIGFIEQFGTADPVTGKKALDASYVSAWGGTGSVFAIFGHQLNSFIADRWGRRIAFLLAALTAIAGILTEQFVTTMAGWLGGKMVTGLGWGMGQVVALTYIPEVAPVQLRGALLCCYALFVALGQLASAIALLVVNRTTPHHWQRAIYSGYVLVGIFLLLLPFIGESPVFYARLERHEDAKKALKRLYGKIDGYDIEHEYAVIRAEIEHERSLRQNENDSVYKEIFMGTNLLRTLPSFFGLIMIQWSGASVVFSYATYFLQQVGIADPFQGSCIVFTLLVATLSVSFYCTDRFGRRTLLFTGGIGCFICNIILGTLGVVKHTPAVLNATLGVICVWVVIYASCLGGVCWGLSSEIATPRLRARTTAVVVNMSTLFSLLFGYTVPLMLSNKGKASRNWGVKTMYLFACLGAIGLVINYFMLPELKGRTYAELDEMYEKGIPPRRMKAYVTQAEKTGVKKRI
ncbi:hypothetical protein Q8F55_008479 [Vanrija albida]|uniref:Major facilitator superfamily (MFS) profile domain-containing protein n=1 Tax=Vanrija albida TaxID=181172 RepID=A0ABR3PRZ3_9TREE